ncbi:hypothetical protein TcWFU_004241 [Taenia crassiceps]|uniref:Uncharacterized protein n=1 Tax=Taenia crassiceps TaxID=6207 RepID=A0ABR4QKX4_9CEST
MISNCAVFLVPLLALLVLWGHLPACESTPLPSELIIRQGRTLQDLYRYVQRQYLMCLKCPNCPCETKFNIRRRSEGIVWPHYMHANGMTAKDLEEALDDYQKEQYE